MAKLEIICKRLRDNLSDYRAVTPPIVSVEVLALLHELEVSDIENKYESAVAYIKYLETKMSNVVQELEDIRIEI